MKYGLLESIQSTQRSNFKDQILYDVGDQNLTLVSQDQVPGRRKVDKVGQAVQEKRRVS